MGRFLSTLEGTPRRILSPKSLSKRRENGSRCIIFYNKKLNIRFNDLQRRNLKSLPKKSSKNNSNKSEIAGFQFVFFFLENSPKDNTRVEFYSIFHVKKKKKKLSGTNIYQKLRQIRRNQAESGETKKDILLFVRDFLASNRKYIGNTTFPKTLNPKQ